MVYPGLTQMNKMVLFKDDIITLSKLASLSWLTLVSHLPQLFISLISYPLLPFVVRLCFRDYLGSPQIIPFPRSSGVYVFHIYTPTISTKCNFGPHLVFFWVIAIHVWVIFVWIHLLAEYTLHAMFVSMKVIFHFL